MVSHKSTTFFCSFCHKPFYRPPSRRPKGLRVFCRWEHRAAGADTLHVIALRFWEKVARCEHGEDCGLCCWVWHGATTHDGYGKFYIAPHGEKPRMVRAHRVAFFLANGRYPEPNSCHNCPSGDNPLCVNFHHLWEGDNAANSADAAQKGRMLSGDANGARRHKERLPRGMKHYKARYTEEEVCLVRAMAQQKVPQKDIARTLGMSRKYVWKVIHGHLRQPLNEGKE